MPKAKDVESPRWNEIKGLEFDKVSVRQVFVRKVYAVLTLQILITIGVSLLFTLNDDIKHSLIDKWPIFLGCSVAVGVLIIIMACFTYVRRKYPMNYIVLFLFTSLMSLVVGFLCIINEEKHVLTATIMTAGMIFALTLFTFQTKHDFTRWGPFLLTVVAVLLLSGSYMLIYNDRIAQTLYSATAAFSFSVYIITDTQLILGRSEYELSPGEYVFAALTLYADVVMIFGRLLQGLRLFKA